MSNLIFNLKNRYDQNLDEDYDVKLDEHVRDYHLKAIIKEDKRDARRPI